MATAVTYDNDGSSKKVFVVGHSRFNNSLPSFTPSGAYVETINYGIQGLILELDEITGQPIWMTPYSGGYIEFRSCTVDPSHNLIVVGDDQKQYVSNCLTCIPCTSGTTSNTTLCNPGNGTYWQYLPAYADVSAPLQFDGLIIRSNSNRQLTYGSLFGGGGDDYLNDVTVDIGGNIWIIGTTYLKCQLPIFSDDL